MAIKYLAGNRLWGTDAERLALLASGETTIYSQTTASSNMFNFESGNVAGGMCIKAGDSLIDEEINKVTFSLSKTDTPPQATLYARVFNTASALTVKHEFGSLATSELTTTTTAYSFSSNLGSTYTLVANDVIAIYCDNSSASYPDDMVLQGGTSGSTSTLKYGDYTGTWGTATGNQLPYLILSLADYPDLPNGATFLTSDTNKLYMWDGTDTWNEVA